MKNKALILILALFAAAFTGAGCNNQKTPPDVTEEKSVNIVDSGLTMDYFDSYVLDVELVNTEGVIWESSAPSIVSVDENGRLTSTYESGKATITATSGDKSDTCEVNVLMKSSAPVMKVDTNAILSEGDEYKVTASVYYKNAELTDYLDFSCNAIEGTDDGVASATIEKNVVTFKGLAAGNCEYVISTEVFGILYAEKISVGVRNTDVVYIVGGEGASDGRLQLTSDNAVYTSDIEVYENDKRVADEGIEWKIEDESVARIGENGIIEAGYEGTTVISARYKNIRIAVELSVKKDYEYIDIQSESPLQLDLQMGIKADASKSLRTYTPNQERVCNVKLSENNEEGKVVRAFAGEIALDSAYFTYENGTVEVNAAAFGTNIYGEKTLKIEVESKKSVRVYTLKVLLITKILTSPSHLKDAIVAQWKGDRITGYFALDRDIDYNFYELSVYATDWNWSNGFRGTLDGMGHSIKNVRTVMYGMSAQMGEGAVIKNLKFPNVRYKGGETTLFTRGAVGVTFENIEITLTEDSTCDFSTIETSCGLLVSHDMRRCVYKNIVINAHGKTLQRIFGGSGNEKNSSVYENITIYAESVKYYENDSSKIPNGVELKKD